MMNPMTEQIICVKAVDLIADAIERELHRTGAHHFFRDASEHEERGDLEEWLVKISDDLNLIIDVRSWMKSKSTSVFTRFCL